MNLRGYVARISGAFCAKAPSLACDTSGLGGCGLIIYGVWLIFPPAAYLVAGVMLLLGAWFGARRT
jgi:hypothetical protein